jgi:hypothetical protein
MARHPRRTALLVAFYLLAATASAYAECARVLWAVNMPAGTFPVRAFSGGAAQQECRKRETREGAFVDVPAKDPHGPLPHYVCLPDTIDPRGPKGK